MDGWGFFFVLGTYGGWVATLENPFGTLEALETLGTLCVALCGDKVRTIFDVAAAVSQKTRSPGIRFFCVATSRCHRRMFV